MASRMTISMIMTRRKSAKNVKTKRLKTELRESKPIKGWLYAFTRTGLDGELIKVGYTTNPAERGFNLNLSDWDSIRFVCSEASDRRVRELIQDGHRMFITPSDDCRSDEQSVKIALRENKPGILYVIPGMCQASSYGYLLDIDEHGVENLTKLGIHIGFSREQYLVNLDRVLSVMEDITEVSPKEAHNWKKWGWDGYSPNFDRSA